MEGSKCCTLSLPELQEENRREWKSVSREVAKWEFARNSRANRGARFLKSPEIHSLQDKKHQVHKTPSYICKNASVRKFLFDELLPILN